MVRMRSIALILVSIMLISTIGTTISTQHLDDSEMSPTSIGNMPKNIAELGDTGKYTSLKIDALNNPHIAYYDAENGDLIYTNTLIMMDLSGQTSLLTRTGMLGNSLQLMLVQT